MPCGTMKFNIGIFSIDEAGIMQTNLSLLETHWACNADIWGSYWVFCILMEYTLTYSCPEWLVWIETHQIAGKYTSRFGLDTYIIQMSHRPKVLKNNIKCFGNQLGTGLHVFMKLLCWILYRTTLTPASACSNVLLSGCSNTCSALIV